MILTDREKVAILLDFVHDYINGTYEKKDEFEKANEVVGEVKSNDYIDKYLQSGKEYK
jgi:hypothetical protein